MKNRLCAVLMATLLLLSCILTGCATIDEESGEDLVDTSGYACIKVYGVKEASTTDAAIEAVEEAINKITLKEFKTKIKLMLFTEDEYLGGIKAAQDGLAEIEAANKQAKADARAESKRLSKLKNDDYEAYRKEILAKQEENRRLAKEKAAREEQLRKEAEAAGEEYIPEIEVPEYAIDVLLIRNVGELEEFKRESMLRTLSEYVNLDYKDIAKYIHPSLLNMGRINSALYGVVNNTFAGEAQYAVFDTELYEKYKDLLKDLSNLGSYREFLEEVLENEPDVIPLLNVPEYVPDGDYLLGQNNPIGVYNPDNSTDNSYQIINLYTSTPYQAYFNYIFTYRKAGMLPDDASALSEDTRWALKFVSGDEYTKKELEEQGYTVMTFSKPRITTENCNVSFYGVYADSAYPTRAMQFIEMLTTNKELETLFQYGIEGVNYTLDGEGRAVMLNDEYNINKSYVGNRFISYPAENEKTDIFDIAREMNKTVKVSALYGKTFDYSKEYIEEYTAEKVKSNVSAGANAASGETFSYFVNGSYVDDQYSAEYEEELKNYCLNYAVGGGYFMTSPYVEEKDGFYVGSTVRSKLDIPTKFNSLIKAELLPDVILDLMKQASASDDIKEYSMLVQDADNAMESTYYSVYPINYQGKTVGLVCSISYMEDTMAKLESILSEYWDDITTGIPNSSLVRFADNLAEKVDAGKEKIRNAQTSLKNANTPEAKEYAKTVISSLPSELSIIKDMISGISDDEKTFNAYATKLLGYYNSYKSGKLSRGAYRAAVANLMRDDYPNIWNVWDEITDMNNRFANETNISSLIDILNKQYK